jgi:hypothetical protein
MAHYTDEQISRLLAERTPGEWEAEHLRNGTATIWRKRVSYAITRGVSKSDAELIAAAPAIIEQQQAEIAQLRAENEHLRHMLREMTGCIDWMHQGYSIAQYQAFYETGKLPKEESEAADD